MIGCIKIGGDIFDVPTEARLTRRGRLLLEGCSGAITIGDNGDRRHAEAFQGLRPRGVTRLPLDDLERVP